MFVRAVVNNYTFNEDGDRAIKWQHIKQSYFDMIFDIL